MSGYELLALVGLVIGAGLVVAQAWETRRHRRSSAGHEHTPVSAP